MRRPVQAAFGGGDTDGFLAAIDPHASELRFATFLGGRGRDLVEGLALSAGGRLWVAGLTSSTNLPATGGLQPRYGGGAFDAMVASVDLASLRGATHRRQAVNR